jgi:ATP-dependent DNA helicase RecG
MVLGLKDRKHFLDTHLRPALNAGFIEMTIPDKPLSSQQRYRLTAAGKACLRAHPPKE